MKNCMQIELLIKLKKNEDKNQEVKSLFISYILYNHHFLLFISITNSFLSKMSSLVSFSFLSNYYFIILTSKCIHLENIRKRHAFCFFSQVINVT